ncbi:MAG: hypothetical protein ACRD4B_10925, partial [Acidobacteriota bacterium]
YMTTPNVLSEFDGQSAVVADEGLASDVDPSAGQGLVSYVESIGSGIIETGKLAGKIAALGYGIAVGLLGTHSVKDTTPYDQDGGW